MTTTHNKRSQHIKVTIIVALFAAIAVLGFGIVKNTGIMNTFASTELPADINSDGKVDVFDLSILLGKWNTTDTLSDLNKDGIVNVFDLSMLLAKWGAVATGTSCAAGEVGTPPNCYPTPPAPQLSGKRWKMLFNDEFDGTSLNLTNFTPCFDWNYGACTTPSITDASIMILHRYS